MPTSAVIMYSTRFCPYCIRTRHNVPQIWIGGIDFYAITEENNHG